MRNFWLILFIQKFVNSQIVANDDAGIYIENSQGDNLHLLNFCHFVRCLSNRGPNSFL